MDVIKRICTPRMGIGVFTMIRGNKELYELNEAFKAHGPCNLLLLILVKDSNIPKKTNNNT